MEKKFTLGIIGAGNMASAILGGILRAGIVPADKIALSDPDPEKRAGITQKKVAALHGNKPPAAQPENL